MAHISLVTLGVSDLERAAAFYAALGWRRSPASVPGEVVFLQGGTVVLSLFGRDDFAADTGLDLSAEGTAPVALAMNVASEGGVDDVLAAAAAAGGRVVIPGHRAAWGGYTSYLADPDGHLWEIAHNPGFGLNDDGRLVLPGADTAE